MNSCVKIEVDLDFVPLQYRSEGNRFYLDLPDNFNQVLSKSLEELSDINELRTEGVLDFTIPTTSKNDFALKRFVESHLMANNYDPLAVICMVNSHVLPHKLLYVRSLDSSGYSCSLFNSDHWLPQIGEKLLTSLDLGTYLFDETVISDRSATAIYDDSDDLGVNFPIINYGSLFDNRVVNIRAHDLRPTFYSIYLLREIFKQFTTRWEFHCPLLETDVGRTVSSYILDEDFMDANNADIRSRFAYVRRDTQFDVLDHTGAGFPDPKYLCEVEWEHENDPNDNFDLSINGYVGVGFHDIECVCEVTFDIDQDYFEYDEDGVFLQLVLITVSGSVVVLSEWEVNAVDFALNNYRVELKSTDVAGEDGTPVLQGDVVKLYAGYRGARDDIKTFRIEQGSYMRITPRKNLLQLGDTVQINKLIGKDYKALDYIKGHAHLFNWKFHTDYLTREVTAYSPFDIEYYSESVEGYFIADTNNLLQKAQLRSDRGEVIPNRELERYILLAFSDSSDKKIEELNLPDENPLHSKRLDLGVTTNERVNELQNPFFEPTLNTECNYGTLDGRYAVLAAMIDNEKDDESGIFDTSFDISPRIFLLRRGEQWQPEDESWYKVEFQWLGVVTSLFLNAFQKNPAPINFTDEPEYETRVLIYGEDELDHYNLFYKNWLNTTIFNVDIELLIFLEIYDYFKFSFRERYIVEYLGKYTLAYMTAITDFQSCSDVSTPVKLLPVKGGAAYSGTLSDPYDSCPQNPSFALTLNSGCWEVSDIELDPDTPAIDTTTVEWKYTDETTWTNIDIALEVCDPLRAFTVRVIITTISGCVYVTSKTVKPCDYMLELIAEYDTTNSCLEATIVGDTSDVDGTPAIEYSPDDGSSWFAYTGCLTIQPDNEYLFRVTISFTNGCADLDLETSFIWDDTPIIDCTELDFGLEEVDAGNGTFVFNRLTTNIPSVALDVIKWRKIDSNDDPVGDMEWRYWDEITPVEPYVIFPPASPCRIEAIRVIAFRNNVCPIKESDPIIFSCE